MKIDLNPFKVLADAFLFCKKASAHTMKKLNTIIQYLWRRGYFVAVPGI